MPRTKSVKKSLRVSERKRAQNLEIKQRFKLVLKKLTKTKEKGKLLSQAFSAIDKAAKKRVLAKNKAAHLKSALARRFKTVKPKSLAVSSSTKTKKKRTTKSRRSRPGSVGTKK